MPLPANVLLRGGRTQVGSGGTEVGEEAEGEVVRERSLRAALDRDRSSETERAARGGADQLDFVGAERAAADRLLDERFDGAMTLPLRDFVDDAAVLAGELPRRLRRESLLLQ